jgi:SNF2 family DNA or RNA helicase
MTTINKSQIQLDNIIYKTEPEPHQHQLVLSTLDKEYYGLWLTMGAGKSKIAIDTACNLHRQGKISSVVIVVRKSLVENWKRELEKHASVEYFVLDKYDFDSPKKSEAAQKMLVNNPDTLRFLILNIETFQTATKAAQLNINLYLQHFHCKDSLFILDEATDIKDMTANRTKSIIKTFQNYKYRRLLTGTLITESPENCFSLYYLMNPKILNFPTVYAFKNYYCIFKTIQLGNRSFKKIVGYRYLTQLRDKLLDIDHATHIKKEDLKLTKKHDPEYRYFDMLPGQKHAYKQMQKELLYELENGDTFELTSAMHKQMKLLQLSAGVLHTDEQQLLIVDMKDNPRYKILKEIIEDVLPNKVVIFSLLKSKKLIQELEEQLRKDFKEYGDVLVTYTGDTSQEDRAMAVERFENPASECKIFLGNNAASRGLTLVQSNVTVFFSNDFSFETREQAESRSHRIGQDRDVHIIDIVARGSEDEKILDALRGKKDLSEYLTSKKKERKEII